MTDNEIIKALECCSSQNVLKGCEDCPLNDKKEDCRNILDFKILDLINRQREVIEQLEVQNGKLKKFFSVKFDRDELEEIVSKQIKMYKVELIREFAEIVKAEDFDRCIDIAYDGSGEVKRAEIRRVLFNKQIDNLVKEMIGDDDNAETPKT